MFSKSNTRRESFDLYRKPTTGDGNEELLLATPPDRSHRPHRTGRATGNPALSNRRSRRPNFDIWALPMNGDRSPFPVVQTSISKRRTAQFSPDGKWIAYQSNETGRFEIYVQPFPDGGRAERISTTGGAQVRWRRDGKELFYIALDGRLMAVPIRFDRRRSRLETGAPVPLFATRVGGAVQALDRQQYVVAPRRSAVPDEHRPGRPQPFADYGHPQLEAETSS